MNESAGEVGGFSTVDHADIRGSAKAAFMVIIRRELPRTGLADLRHFLMRADGVHLWADIEEQRAYLGILPLEDWTDAASGPYAYVFDTPPRAALIISYRQDTAGFAVLDTEGPSYFWCDLYGSPELIGTTVEDLLAHWWKHCRLDPRETS